MTLNPSMRIVEDIEVRWNLEIDLFERGKRRRWHQRTHNIIVNTGRQMFCEVITASSFAPITRTQDTVVRYIGFGIGGNMQIDPTAYAAAYPAGYGGTNLQNDSTVTVAGLERPVLVTAAPLWARQISTPGTFPTGQSTKFIASFAETDISFGAYASVPLSEIALYKSSGDPALPNCSAGAYPGASGHTMAYDTFNTISKTGVFSILVQWEFRF